MYLVRGFVLFLLLSEIKSNQRNQIDQMNQISATRQEVCDVPRILSACMLRCHCHMPIGAEMGGGPGGHCFGELRNVIFSSQGRPPAHSIANPSYPIAAQIFCAFSPVNVMSSCVVELRSK